MKTLLITVSVLAVGCGSGFNGPDELQAAVEELKQHPRFDKSTYLTEHHVPCIGTVTSDWPAARSSIVTAIAAAREELDAHGLVPKEDFCDTYRNVTVHIRKEDSWESTVWTPLPHTELINGRYAAGHIELSLSMGSLVHELLHHWDTIHFGFGTLNHTGWCDNGYYNASDEFSRRSGMSCYMSPEGKMSCIYSPSNAMKDICAK